MDKKFMFSEFKTSSPHQNVKSAPDLSAYNFSYNNIRNERGKKIGLSKRHTKSKTSFSGELLLLSLCTGAFMLLFIYKLVNTQNIAAVTEGDVVAAMRDITDNRGHDEANEETEETLGKLKLVQLPSILEVFAPSDVPIPPLAMEQAVVDDENYIAKIYAPSGTEVVSMLPGTVKTITTDETLGGCISVSCEDDIEIFYYGLTDIQVEQGQPILQNSRLGLVANDILCLKVLHRGRPIDPFEFLGIKAEVG